MIEEGRKKEREGVGGRARWELVFYLREATGGQTRRWVRWDGRTRAGLTCYGMDGKTGTGARDRNRNLCGASKSGRKRCSGTLRTDGLFGRGKKIGNGNGKMGNGVGTGSGTTDSSSISSTSTSTSRRRTRSRKVQADRPSLTQGPPRCCTEVQKVCWVLATALYYSTDFKVPVRDARLLFWQSCKSFTMTAPPGQIP